MSAGGRPNPGDGKTGPGDGRAELWARVVCDNNDPESDAVIARIFSGDELRGKRVLDYGCSTGGYAVALRRRGAVAVAGFDLNPASIAAANALAAAALTAAERETVTFACAAADTVRYPAEQFELVFMNAVIYYLEDPDETLDRIAAWLAPGGRLFISFNKRTPLLRLVNAARRRLAPALAPRWDRVVDGLALVALPFLRLTGYRGTRAGVRRRLYGHLVPIRRLDSPATARALLARHGFTVEREIASVCAAGWSTDFGLLARRAGPEEGKGR